MPPVAEMLWVALAVSEKVMAVEKQDSLLWELVAVAVFGLVGPLAVLGVRATWPRPSRNTLPYGFDSSWRPMPFAWAQGSRL